MRAELGLSPVARLASGLPVSINSDLPSGVTNKVPPPPSTSMDTICKALSLATACPGKARSAAKGMELTILRSTGVSPKNFGETRAFASMSLGYPHDPHYRQNARSG